MIDHVALLPVYCAAGAAVLVLLADLIWPGRRSALLALGACGPVGAVACAGFARGSTFCVPDCSFVADRASAALVAVFCLLTLLVLAMSVPAVESGAVPAGEYTFLLLCSLTGGVVLASARDLLSLIVALETLTLPLYALTGLRRDPRSAEAAVTFFIVSVVSTAVTLLGAALLYAVTGAVHLTRLAAALGHSSGLPLTRVAVVLVLAGLAFKLAAVPFHGWAPGTYDGAPLPVALYLSTASKLGGVVAIGVVAVIGLRPYLATAGALFAVVAVLTMTVGNLVALRQRRMVRLLAWSSVAQAGYVIAPLAVLPVAVVPALAGTLSYMLLYVLINAGVFGAVIAVRGAGDGGDIEDYRGLARRSPWVAAVLVIGLAGLAGLPPGFAGLFAKVAVVRALVGGSAGWLAVVVGVNAVVGLAYYARVAAVLFAAPSPVSVAEPVMAGGGSLAGGASSAGGGSLAGAPGAGPPAGGSSGSSPGGSSGSSPGGSLAAGSREGGSGVTPEPPVGEPVAGRPLGEAGTDGLVGGRFAGRWAAVAAALVATAGAVVAGFAPQLVFDVSSAIADLWA